MLLSFRVGKPELEGWVAADVAQAGALSAPFAKLSADTLGSLGEGLGGRAMPLWDQLFAIPRTSRSSA